MAHLRFNTATKFLATNVQVIGIVLLTLCIGVFAWILLAEGSSELRGYVDEVTELCADAPHRSTCYNESVPEYYTELGFKEMFDLVNLVQREDPAYGYCHLTAHKIAEYEVQRDPSQWMDIMVKCPPNGMCANGCMHGALITRFVGAEEGMSDGEIDQAVLELDGACEPREGWNPTGLDKGNCYHGLGHLSMYMTLGDIGHSLAVCDRIAKQTPSGNMSELCYGGVFMQLFQPLEPEDFAMVAHIDVSRENFTEFCSSFPRDGGRSPCFQRGSMLFEGATSNGPAMKEFCEQSSDASIVEQCYDMVFSLVGSGSDFNLNLMDSICRTVEDERQGHCYGMATINMIDADPMFVPEVPVFCSMAPNDAATDECYTRVARYAPYRFNRGTPEYEALCSVLPEDKQPRCAQQ